MTLDVPCKGTGANSVQLKY